MGLAYYIVLDNEDLDCVVDGKAVAEHLDELDQLCAQLSVTALSHFVGMGSEEITDVTGDDVDIPDLDGTWFEAAAGLVVVNALREYLHVKPEAIAEAEAVLADLDDYRAILAEAKAHGAKWHLTLDI